MFATIRQIISAAVQADAVAGGGIIDNYIIYPQTWGSTALGFDHAGGDMITTASTTAIETNGRIFVYFGSKLAYSKLVKDLPDGLYTRIFNLHDAPSVREFLQLVSAFDKEIR